MRSIVGFRSSVEPSPPSDPRGEPTATVIADGLKDHGLRVVESECYRDIATAYRVRRGAGTAWFFVGYLGLDLSAWQLIAPADPDLFGGDVSEKTRHRLVDAIHAVLTADDRFSEIRWFETFSDSPDDDWSPTPS
jgi:hypothetical protein